MRETLRKSFGLRVASVPVDAKKRSFFLFSFGKLLKSVLIYSLPAVLLVYLKTGGTVEPAPYFGDYNLL